MIDKLRTLIRESIGKVLNEKNIARLASNISPDVKVVTDAFKKIQSNYNLAKNYAWTPQGSANGELNTHQFNMLVEMVYEYTDENTAKLIFMSLYHYTDTALNNALAKYLRQVRNVVATPEALKAAAEKCWTQMFMVERNKKGTADKFSFEYYYNKYTPMEKGNFGGYFFKVLGKMFLNSYKDITTPTVTDDSDAFIKAPASLDATPYSSGNKMNMYDKISPEEYENKLRGNTPYDRTLGNKLANSMPNKSYAASTQKARRMIKALITSLKKAINEFSTKNNPTPAQQRGLKALSELVSSGDTPAEISKRLGYNITSSIQDLKKNRAFVSMVDDTLLANGFVNSKGKVDSFMNMQPLYIAKAVNYMETGNVDAIQDLKEGVFWFIDNLLAEHKKTL